MTARFSGALLLLSLLAGFLVSALLYPPAVVGVVIASVALAVCLGRIASEDIE
jgi:hypothetical protein